MIIAGFCAALVAVPAAAVAANRQGETISRSVKYSKAELSTPDGAGRVAARIRYAADHVCGGDSLILRTTRSFERCRRQTLDRAVAELNAPLVAEALGARTTEVAAAR